MSINLLTTGTGITFLDDTGNYSTPAGGGAAQVFYANGLNGLFPEQQTSTKTRFYAGTCSAGATNPASAINLGANFLDVDMTTVGAGGLDTGTLAVNTAYYFYALRDLANTATTVIASTSGTFGGISYTNLAAYVGGTITKLPFGQVYKTTIGFPDFRIHGWGSMSPEIYYQNWDMTNYAPVINGGTATTFTNADVYTGANKWVPGNARRVHITYQLTSTGTAIDLLYQLNIGGAGTMYAGSVAAASGTKAGGSFWVTITSAGIFNYKLSGAGSVKLWATGYAMSDT